MHGTTQTPRNLPRRRRSFISHRLERIRLNLHRTLHEDTKGKPARLQTRLSNALRQKPKRKTHASTRPNRQQRTRRKHVPPSRCTTKTGQRFPNDDLPRKPTRHQRIPRQTPTENKNKLLPKKPKTPKLETKHHQLNTDQTHLIKDMIEFIKSHLNLGYNHDKNKNIFI